MHCMHGAEVVDYNTFHTPAHVHRVMEFQLSAIEEPDSISPLQTFAVHGRTLYVDGSTFENKELLEELVPASPYTPPDQAEDDEEFSSISQVRERPKDAERHGPAPGSDPVTRKREQGTGKVE
jgi:hypothetical protein